VKPGVLSAFEEGADGVLALEGVLASELDEAFGEGAVEEEVGAEVGLVGQEGLEAAGLEACGEAVAGADAEVLDVVGGHGGDVFGGVEGEGGEVLVGLAADLGDGGVDLVEPGGVEGGLEDVHPDVEAVEDLEVVLDGVEQEGGEDFSGEEGEAVVVGGGDVGGGGFGVELALEADGDDDELVGSGADGGGDGGVVAEAAVGVAVAVDDAGGEDEGDGGGGQDVVVGESAADDDAAGATWQSQAKGRGPHFNECGRRCK